MVFHYQCFIMYASSQSLPLIFFYILDMKKLRTEQSLESIQILNIYIVMFNFHNTTDIFHILDMNKLRTEQTPLFFLLIIICIFLPDNIKIQPPSSYTYIYIYTYVSSLYSQRLQHTGLTTGKKYPCPYNVSYDVVNSGW